MATPIRPWWLREIRGALRRIARRLRGREGIGLDDEAVVWAYRLLLGREPESPAVIREKLTGPPSIGALVGTIVTSPEFRARYPSLFFDRGARVYAPLPSGYRICLDLSDLVSREIVRGRHEPAELAWLKSQCAPGATVLDVGAHVGLFTLELAALVGPRGKVYAFEPLAENTALLAESIRHNSLGDVVELQAVAVGETAGAAYLAHDPLGPSAGYLAAGRAGSSPHLELRTIRTVALDDVVQRRPVRLIKLDAEGSELRALRGARRILETDRPAILSEVHPHRLQAVSGGDPGAYIAFVRNLGYECRVLGAEGPGARVDSVTELASVVFLPA